MASSTADVAGVIYAAGYAFGLPFHPEEVARLALRIEPTDGSIFPGIVAFDHREGRFFESLGLPPPLEILVLDFGGTVDTLEYNRTDRTSLLRRMETDYREAFTLVVNGIRRGEVEAVGAGATLSARCHHRLFPRLPFEVVLRLAHEVRALGVNVAHSGTVLGLLLPVGAIEAVIPYARQLSGLQRMIPCRLISGGCRVISLTGPESRAGATGVSDGQILERVKEAWDGHAGRRVARS
jgi:L-threonine kinase